MEDKIEKISVGVSVMTFEEILTVLDSQAQSFEVLIRKCQSILDANKNKHGLITPKVRATFIPLMAYLSTLKDQNEKLYKKLREESGIDSVITSTTRYITPMGNINGTLAKDKKDMDFLDDLYNSVLIDLDNAGYLKGSIKDARKKLEPTNKTIYDEGPKWED